MKHCFGSDCKCDQSSELWHVETFIETSCLVKVWPHAVRATSLQAAHCTLFCTHYSIFGNAIFHVMSSETLEKKGC